MLPDVHSNYTPVNLTNKRTEAYCPPDDYPALNLGGDNLIILLLLVPLDEEEPPCDDIIGNCEEPPTPPDLFYSW